MNEKFYLESDIDEIVNNLKKYHKKIYGKKFLISGANGFLGKYFLKTLLKINNKTKNKIKILAIDIKFDSCELYKDKNVIKIKKDINKIENYNFKCDYILHAAGIPSPKHYYNKPIEAIFTSITATKKLLDYAKKINAKFIFFSSSEIYGNPDKQNIPTKETYNGNVSSIEDRSCYDEGKRVGETLCYFYKIKQKVKCSIFRPFNVFGPGMPKNDYRVFPRFFGSIKKKQPITIFKSGKQTRTFCYVTDAITAMFLVIINGNKFVYNIGNDKPELNMKKLHQLLQKSLNKKIKSINIEYPNNYPQVEPQRRCPDITKLKKDFNFKNKVSITESIKRFYHWSSKYY
jgi:UDP-glucuronate decarboxylase